MELSLQSGQHKGRHFQGSFKELLDENLIDHRMSKAYHPQSNGLAERAIQTITKAYKATCSGGPGKEAQWDRLLPDVVMGYNIFQQASTGTPSFQPHAWLAAKTFAGPGDCFNWGQCSPATCTKGLSI